MLCYLTLLCDLTYLYCVLAHRPYFCEVKMRHQLDENTHTHTHTTFPYIHAYGHTSTHPQPTSSYTHTHTNTPGIQLGTSGAEVDWKSNHNAGCEPKQKATYLGNHSYVSLSLACLCLPKTSTSQIHHSDFEKESQALSTSAAGCRKFRTKVKPMALISETNSQF